MRRFFTALAIVLMVGGLAGGLGAFVFANAGDDGDSPFSVDVRPGEIFRVRLESNPSTGYGWVVDFDATYVEFLRSYMEEIDPTKLGSGGVEVFVFRGLAKGSTEITFSYKRSWEAEVLKTVVYEVKVSGDPVVPTDVYTKEESQPIAWDFVVSSPTFAFDGMADTLELVSAEMLRCPSCYAFTFRFQSRHAGYGDRTGQMLAQVITNHEARIVVNTGQVTLAVMDDTWDMLSQTMIDSDPGPMIPEESERLARDFVVNSPTFQFDGMVETLELVKVEEFFCIGCYEFTFTFDSRHGGYGDRTGQMVTDAITPHTARVVVERDKVTSAIMDDMWDMLAQSVIAHSDNSISVTSR